MADRSSLRGTRRDIVAVIGDDRLTAHEIGKSLGKPTGSVYGLIQRMLSDGELRTENEERPPTRGAQYYVDPALLATMKDDDSEQLGVGRLRPRSVIWSVVPTDDWAACYAVLAQAQTAGIIDWATENSEGWFLVPDEAADSFVVDRLASRLRAVGCICKEWHVKAIVTGTQLSKRAAELSEQAGTRS